MKINGSLSSFLVAVAAVVSLVGAGSAQAADIAMVSGLFKNESHKVDGSNAGGKSEISAGVRYHDDLATNMGWFGHGVMRLKSYKAGANTESPDNSTGIELGGGVRWYFTPFTASAVPFASILGSYKNDKEVQNNSASSFTEIEASGLYYAGSGGVRIGMDTRYWLELETIIFNSALYATEKSVRSDTANNVTTTSKRQSTKTELFVESAAPITSTLVSFGMKL